MSVRLAAATLLAFCIAPAVAAAADCTRQPTAYDKIVCADPELGAAERKLGKTLSSTLDPLSSDARKAVNDGQRSWSEFVRTVCRLGDGAASDDAAACIRREQDQRQKQLAAERSARGPMTIYRVDAFTAEPATSAGGERPGFVTTMLAFPQIDRPRTAVERAWNPSIEARARALVGAAEQRADADVAVDYAVTLVTPDVLSVKLLRTETPRAAASPATSEASSMWLLLQGRELKAADLFPRRGDWGADLAKSVFAELTRDRAASDYTLGVEDLAPLVAAEQRWSLDPNGLEIRFEPGEIAPFTLGALHPVVPWAELKPLLGPKPPFAIPPGR